MKKTKQLFSLLLITVLLLGFAACGENESDTGTAQSQTETTVSHLQSDSGTNSGTDPEPEVPLPVYYNPLTGLQASYDVSGNRPIAVMVNNIRQSLPQEGISQADILLECLVEGGITRLMCVFSEYRNLGVIGSVRSCRPYYLDFAQTFDAIYCHAGGSDDAYSQIASRKINNIDGVKKDPLDVYYRDAERRKTMALEHTLMTSGQGIIDTIGYFNYRTTLREGYQYPFSFPEVGSSAPIGEMDATHIYVPMSGYQKVDYVYNEASGEYLRYQYNGQKHVDNTNKEQLSFKNVILLFCKTYVYDAGGRLKIDTVGTGTGYLISEGKATVITWSRTDKDGNMTLTNTATGENIVINRGKTAINVCPLTITNDVKLNATERQMNG